jgi:hypothetical protein
METGDWQLTKSDHMIEAMALDTVVAFRRTVATFIPFE